MTTLTNTLHGFVTHFEGRNLEEMGVPPEILGNVKGMIFSNKIVPGRVSHYSHGGFFSCIDSETGGWTYPVALQFLAGNISSWSAYERVELLVLITDEEVCQLLKSLGQIGFNTKASHKLEKGISLRSDRFDPATYRKAKLDPEFGLKSCYAYHVEHKLVHEAEARDVIWQFRTSSNEKFYGTRNASLHNIIKLNNLTPEDAESVAFKAIKDRWPQKNHVLADQCRAVLSSILPVSSSGTAAPATDAQQAPSAPSTWSSVSSRPPAPRRPPAPGFSSSSETSSWGQSNSNDDLALAGLAPASTPMADVTRSRASTWNHSMPQPTAIARGWGGSSGSARSDFAAQTKVPAPIAESPAETPADTVEEETAVLRQSSFEFR
ncbi:Hypothetical Protein FCC1311_095152 [Hondaea fermentalgiana]|uniref:Uncharacterized protein n=1 Tax=Hondaea fermentalgiana TaxID=2315210 RepID=A0A2R5GXX9_9STRA|nr:Hypothetical Protein FCC1311_095152 [Hondaea fermentalgiana]|eukprot:GBG33291.1 Hypothetical Protein FCC1311_095152 [Hondaea fermentalgiana]